MADTDKNILITPNVGQSAEPKVEFTGADNTTVTAYVLDDGSIAYESAEGELLKVSNSLTGELFSVNDVSGIPSITAHSDGEVVVYRSFTVPVGTSGQRPSSPSTGSLRMNTTLGSLEFYDGENWIATNLIPTITANSGTIVEALATTISITAIGVTDIVTVVFEDNSGTELAESGELTVTSGSAFNVTVPSDVYTAVSSSDTVKVKVKNTDGTLSGSVSYTVAAAPSGGTITTSGNYRIHTFTSSGNFVNTVAGLDVGYLLVAGGGGGGVGNTGSSLAGGGGGAGGMLTGSSSNLSATTYPVVVGTGGAGGAGPNSDSIVDCNTSSSGISYQGSDGNDSTFNSLTAYGGGGGGSRNNIESGRDGGSGGGASGTAACPPGSGVTGQGYRGGNGNGGSDWQATGGGGAGGSGGDDTFGGTPYNNTPGGDGASSSITGSAVTYAGGGGGGGMNQSASGDPTGASGGSGGGGDGGTWGSSTITGYDGTTNLGGGGGGAPAYNQNAYGAASGMDGGAGGKGIVVIRYDVTNPT